MVLVLCVNVLGGMVIIGYLLLESRKQYRQFRSILPLTRIFKFTWLNSVIFPDFNEGSFVKIDTFLVDFDCFSTAYCS